MFSVITHQDPGEAARIFSMLRPCAERLYFTAFIDEATDGYVEGSPQQPGLMSTYSSPLMRRILAETGWSVDRVYDKSWFQLTAFVCSAC